PRRERDPLRELGLRMRDPRRRAHLWLRVPRARVFSARCAAAGYAPDLAHPHRGCVRAAAGGVRAMMLVAVVVAATLASPRFFLAGDGTLGLVSAHSGETATVTYRRADGTYDPDALAKIRRVMRSRDGSEGDVSLRLVELLAHVYAMRGKQP